ncbi:hypothetical protein vseg_021514 [Gypsophila vaccaria]
MKAKRGHMKVQICSKNEKEDDNVNVVLYQIPITYLNHPLFMDLLDKAHEVYGYHVNGPLKLPCSIDDFLDLRWKIEKENSLSSCHSSRRLRHYQKLECYDDYVEQHTMPFRSC